MSSSAAEVGTALDGQCYPLRLELTSAPKWKAIDFDIQHQDKTNWCWAALAASVAKFYDNSSRLTQCEIANGELDRADCCENSTQDPCNVYGFLMSSLYRVGHFEEWRVRRPNKSKDLQQEIRHLVQTDITGEVEGGRPLCSRIVWTGGGAHFIAIYGYAIDTEVLGVAIADPWWGLSDVDWNDFPMRYRMGAVYTDSYCTSGS